MKNLFSLAFLGLIPLACAQPAATSIEAWAPKPLDPVKYVPPNKPITRLPDLLAKHKGEASWQEPIVRDDHIWADYIQSAPGEQVSRRFHPDTREWWVVMDGQIRFEIEGRPRFIASKGAMVQVPMQTIYSMETAGDKPSLRFQANIAKAKTLYPKDVEPPKMLGWEWLSVRMSRTPGIYDKGNKPVVTFDELAKGFEGHGPSPFYRVVMDDRAVANFIYGHASDLPPLNPKDRGHYHPECAEFWLIMAGQIRYPIENQGVIIADVGDVVYVPPFTFHAPRFWGDGASCRLAMNGYANIAHLFESSKPH
ncbi:MAG: cupin domain-containing protein [Acidobacteriota bacterium]|nr:cupin domain-containing protein [Acidobacteriota bacterium]